MEIQERAPSPPPPPAADHSAAGDQPLGVAKYDDRIEDSGPTVEGSPSARVIAVLPSDAASLRDDLFDAIVRQVEYCFSDANLPNDKFLLKQMAKDKEGFVPVPVIASFKKMKKLTKDLSIIEAALRTSSLIVFSSDGNKVKMLHPLPLPEIRDIDPQTVLVENLPKDHSEDNIWRIFGTVGHIVAVTVCDPHSEEALATLKKPDLAISSKLHALIEYDTVEAAERAVSALNDDDNWSGMRVQLLSKRKEEKLGNGGGKGGRKRNKSRGKGHHYHFANGQGYQPKPTCGQGHGTIPSGCSAEGGITSKPIPGPKMPDGTRGFTMGRGRSIAT
ncbi:hypothetical protein KSP39_PZI015502 [Platanthera zijinensis]|uniref:La-related protein 6A n=1 Tax=Platanthera zijinensis TaxID=2320716 RepID=A0AAP0G208_9ASPA